MNIWLKKRTDRRTQRRASGRHKEKGRKIEIEIDIKKR